MKRGKRQVQQRTEVYQNHEEGQLTSSQEQNQFTNFYENGFSNYHNNQTANIQNQHEGAKDIQHKTKNSLTTSLNQVRNNQNSIKLQTSKEAQNQVDQKKRKIQLLKQKYLKKNATQKKQQETKHQITKDPSQILNTQSLIVKKQPKKLQINSQSIQQNNIKQRIVSKGKQIPQTVKINQSKLLSNQQEEKNQNEGLKTINSTINKTEINCAINGIDSHTKKEQINVNPSNGINNLNNSMSGKVPPPPVGKRNAPPPPPISNNKGVSNVLNRKFNRETVQQQKQQNAFKLIDPFDNNEQQNQNEILDEYKKSHQKHIQVDEEHLQINQTQTSNNKVVQQHSHTKNQNLNGQFDHNKASKSEQNIFNIEQVLKYWIQNPQQALKTIYPSKKQLIQYFFLSKFLRPQLTSKNPSFTNIMRKLIQTFIIHNQTAFNADQKKIVEEVFITFFYSNPKDLDDIFLVGLIKTGENSILKYKQILKQKFEFYLQRLILLKNLLLKQEINNFIQLCLSPEFFYQQIYVYLFMLSPQDQKLIQKLQTFDFQSEKVMLSLLILCRINLKNKSIVGLYLKLLSNLTQLLSKYKFAETVLRHLKQIEIPQSLYQSSKQLKLKLLKNYQEKQKKQENVQKNAKDGLFKYFNKAIDKIKSTTTTTINNTVQKTATKQQQSKDVIVYDSVLKRYVINGVVPEDQNQKKKSSNNQEQEKKTPPPPPLGKKNQPPPPPSLPGRKGGNRLVNRYT